MIDTGMSLLSHDRKRVFVRDLIGPRGLMVVCVGRGGERGFQMLYRFSGLCDRLDECGINVAFVYQKESARHVQDAASVLAARYRRKPCLLLDDDGRFFIQPLRARSLRAVHFGRDMERLETAELALQGEAWDLQLRALMERAAADAMR